MSQEYIIFSDISADIPAEYAKEKGVMFLPMSYSLGDEQRICDCIEPPEVLKAFYDGQRAGVLTHTTQISPYQYEESFKPYMSKGMSVLYLSLSSGLSSTYSSSLLAANDLNEKYKDTGAKLVSVDSLGATVGMGMLIELAVKNREAGMSIEENAAWLEENRLRIYHWFMVEDLMHLKRGGRISPATAVVGTALNIKPILKINTDGTLSAFEKKRGAKGAMNELLELYKAHSTHEQGERVFVTHADAPDRAEYLCEQIREFNPSAGISCMMLSPIIGAHVGPGMCGIVHLVPEGLYRP